MERLGIAFSGGPARPRSSTASCSPRASATSRPGWRKGMAATSSRSSPPRARGPRGSGSAPASPASLSAPRRRSRWRPRPSTTISGGRFILGIGSSHKVQVEAEHGVSYSKPLTRVRETVAVIRDLLRDGTGGIPGRDGQDRELRSVVHAAAPAASDLCLRGVPENDRAVRRDRRRHHADPQHARHRRPRPRAARRRGAARRPRPGGIVVSSLLPTWWPRAARRRSPRCGPGSPSMPGFSRATTG